MKAIELYVAVALFTAAGIAVPPSAARADGVPREERARCSERLSRILESTGSRERLKLWIYFRDHGSFSTAAETGLSKRSLRRRRIRSAAMIDSHDLPVDPYYISSVRARAVELRHVSRYLNAVSALVDLSDVAGLSRLPFVEYIDIVETYRRVPLQGGDLTSAGVPLGTKTQIYGGSFDQLDQIDVVPLLELGYNGSGAVSGSDPILVCVMDTGFRLDHEALAHVNVVARYDFVQGDTIVHNQDEDHPEQDKHGTIVLGALAGYHEGDLVGPAWGADFLLAKTEIYGTEIEIEEDNWVAGIEWADSAGADVVSSSLGYVDWYTPGMLDGDTPLCTRIADIAAGHGIVVVTAMGNEGAAGDTTLIAPADGDSVISVGAVARDGLIAYFSSRGPTADGRIKPDLVALGVGTYSAEYPTIDSYAAYSGTSMSTPLIAGLCVQLLEIQPALTPISLRELLTSTASRSDSPGNVYGYGLPDGAIASGLDIDLGPDTILLGGAYPNPFRSRVRFDLGIPEGERVTVRVFDCRGALVKAFSVDSATGDGFAWDGTNAGGLDVAAGLYFVRFTGRYFDRTVKVLLIR